MQMRCEVTPVKGWRSESFPPLWVNHSWILPTMNTNHWSLFDESWWDEMRALGLVKKTSTDGRSRDPGVKDRLLLFSIYSVKCLNLVLTGSWDDTSRNYSPQYQLTAAAPPCGLYFHVPLSSTWRPMILLQASLDTRLHRQPLFKDALVFWGWRHHHLWNILPLTCEFLKKHTME